MEMEGLKHMSHIHPLTLTKYNNTPENATCYGCRDTLIEGNSVYRCSRNRGTSTASSQDFKCATFFLDKKCTELPPHIHHPNHEAHHLSLFDSRFREYCHVCRSECRYFLYLCKPCEVFVCLQCAMQERKLNHQLHSHPLTLLPLKSVFPCGACGEKDIEEFSYLCQTCLFWIHKSCAPKTVICKLHHSDHPLLLSDSFILKSYHTYGLLCSICQLEFDESYWLYYCLDCRFFTHIKCATKPTDENANEVDDEEDVNHSELMQFPFNDDKHYLYYQLIKDFAKTHSSSTSTNNHISTTEDGIISHCTRGHPLSLIPEHRRKDIDELNELLCDGCFQPLAIAADSFYGCVDCKFFLHKVCFTELPRAIKHPSHPEHMILRCLQIGKTITCKMCTNECNGIFYQCEKPSCSFIMDIMCASLPGKIKHEYHKHPLTQHLDEMDKTCNGCGSASKSSCYFSCKSCKFQVHIGCAISPGTIKHRWDEHHLILVYPPVKHHPHEFNCEVCSGDINPNYWFYHCRECDMSFHLRCVNKGTLLSNSSRHILRVPDEDWACAIL